MKDVSVLRQALPYIRRFRGNLFVVKMGGDLVVNKDALRLLATDVTLLHHVGIRVVVVHGGGPQATEMAKKLGQKPRMINGRRVTDAETLEVVKMVFGGSINIEITSALRNAGSRSVGLSGVDGGLIRARRRDRVKMLNPETGREEDVDFGFVGDVVSVDVGLLRTLLADGYIPVIACLGGDDEGNIYNINADTIAQVIAVEMGADKLISLTNVRGILLEKDDPSSLVSYLAASEAERLIAEGVISAGMIPKVTTCINAVRGGVRRACILDGTDPDSLLLEVFTGEGHGTMITDVDEKQLYEKEELATTRDASQKEQDKA